jgi:hypothetical protein
MSSPAKTGDPVNAGISMLINIAVDWMLRLRKGATAEPIGTHRLVGLPNDGTDKRPIHLLLCLSRFKINQ